MSEMQSTLYLPQHTLSFAVTWTQKKFHPQDVLDRTRVKKGGIHAFVELHIEQGPVLEKAREELGLVTAIAAVRRVLPHHVTHTQRSTWRHAIQHSVHVPVFCSCYA